MKRRMSQGKPIDLAALPSDGSVSQFDGMPLAPGVHLRWSFWPELGWPSSGFEVWRRFWVVDEFTRVLPDSWTRIATLGLPPATNATATVMARARTVTSGALTAAYEAEVPSLLRLVDQVRPRTPAFVQATRGDARVNLPSLEVLLLASLDPYVARGIGLAFIDGRVAPTIPADYKVLGKWGTGTCSWSETTFGALKPAWLALGQFAGGQSRWFSNRALSVVQAEGRPPALRLDGISALTLRVLFAAPAREVELDLEAPTATEALTRWRVEGYSGALRMTTATTPRLTITAAGATLRILSPADRLLDKIEIFDTGTATTSWRMTRLRHRRMTGAIGDQWSRIICVAPAPGASVPEEHLDVPWPPPSVVSPAISRTRTVAMPSALDDDGRVTPGRSQVDVLLAPLPAPPSGQPGLTRPVRVNTGYVRAAGGGPARTELLTLPLPLVGQTLNTVGFWRLDGALTGVVGPTLAARGSVRYVDARPQPLGVLEMRRRTVFLTGRMGTGEVGPGYLEAVNVAGLDGNGVELHVQLWVMPTDDPETYPTLVGNDWRTSFWFGLAKGTSTYRLRVWLNGQVFESNGSIPRGLWSHVAFHYDGERIHFFINGVLDISRTAALGPVRLNPRRAMSIGCDPVPSDPAQAFAYPFSGYLADVQVRRGGGTDFPSQHLLAAWTFNGDLLERKSNIVSGTMGAVRFVVDHPEIAARKSILLDGTWCVVAPDNRLADPGRRLCMKARIKPDAGQTTPVLAGTRHWKLWLQASGSSYRLVLTVAGQSIGSSEFLPSGQWSDVIAGVDGERAVVYVNGRPTQMATLRYGRIPRDTAGSVVIGADATSHAGALVMPFRGRLADLEVGDTLPAPAAPIFLIDRERSRLLEDPFPTIPAPPPPSEPPADWVARELEPGSYRFFVQAVDLFGRVGPTNLSGSVALPEPSTPPAPGGARARFLPILGEVLPPAPNVSPWRIQVALSRPTSVDALAPGALLRHDAELAVVTPGPREPGRLKIDHSETCEIVAVEPQGSQLVLDLRPPALPRLRPAPGQRVTVAHDRWVRTEWTWTGTQRLLAPQVDRFQLKERRRLPATDGWTAWAGLGTSGGVPVAHGEVIVQDEAASNLPPTIVSYAEWEELQQSGVLTLPEPARPDAEPDGTRRSRLRIWKVLLPVTAALPPGANHLPPQRATPDEFVSGALVAYNSASNVLAWQIFTVLWHEWSATRGWTLYFVENSKGRDTLPAFAPVLVQARYYPGQRYRMDAMLGTTSAFGTGADGLPVPTVALEIAVAAVDTAGRTSPFDAAPGEPRSGGAADVVAVDRRRPNPPPRPTVRIDRADYHGSSRATLSWEPGGAGESYHVYRATDSAVCARDAEQRRRGTGIYEGLEPAARFADDPDFTAWLAARWPDWAGGWASRLFAARPSDERDTAAMAAWEAANPVWRDWAARFYSTLPAGSDDPSDPHTLQGLAARAGNEDAFTLVNSKPVVGGTFSDTVNGAVRNRYLYRLRSQSASLLRSTAWGPVSLPHAAPLTRLPSTPALTRIEAGERRLTVRWALNTEPELAEYRLYRSRSREALEDLRWWRPGEGERITRIPDPRLRVTDRGLTLPNGLDVAEVLGVFRAEEHGGRALDYFSCDPGAPSEAVLLEGRVVAVRRLRVLPDGAAVVLVYRTSGGEERTLGSLAEGGTYVDLELVAGDDAFYRMAAVDTAGNVSQGSSILQGRAFDTTPPSPPPLSAFPEGEGEARRVRLAWEAEPTVSYQLQRHEPGTPNWMDRSGWLPAGTATFVDEGVRSGVTYRYRLRFRSKTGVLARETSEATCTLPQEE